MKTMSVRLLEEQQRCKLTDFRESYESISVLDLVPFASPLPSLQFHLLKSSLSSPVFRSPAIR